MGYTVRGSGTAIRQVAERGRVIIMSEQLLEPTIALAQAGKPEKTEIVDQRSPIMPAVTAFCLAGNGQNSIAR